MPITDADALLRQGWEALRAADWQTARSCFEQALGEAESAEALDGLSQATHFLREYDRATELKERAFAAYRQEGDPVKAADTARWLAFLHGTYAGNYAVASGWMGRAESVLETVPECAAHGWLVLDSAVFAATAADREKCAVSALAIARRFGDTDLEFDALALLGECQVATGRVAEGMRLLDEAMAAATGGEVVLPRRDRRDLLPPPERLRARDRRATCRAVDGRHPAHGGVDRLRGPDLQNPLRRHPRRARPVGRRPRRSCATRSRPSSAATAATAPSPSSGWPSCACARAATRRRSGCWRGSDWHPTARRANGDDRPGVAAISLWPRSSRGCAWKVPTRTIRAVRSTPGAARGDPARARRAEGGRRDARAAAGAGRRRRRAGVGAHRIWRRGGWPLRRKTSARRPT